MKIYISNSSTTICIEADVQVREIGPETMVDLLSDNLREVIGGRISIPARELYQMQAFIESAEDLRYLEGRREELE